MWYIQCYLFYDTWRTATELSWIIKTSLWIHGLILWCVPWMMLIKIATFIAPERLFCTSLKHLTTHQKRPLFCPLFQLCQLLFMSLGYLGSFIEIFHTGNRISSLFFLLVIEENIRIVRCRWFRISGRFYWFFFMILRLYCHFLLDLFLSVYFTFFTWKWLETSAKDNIVYL